MSVHDISGIWAPLCTPFTEGKIDTAKLEKNMEVYAQTPLRGVFTLGSNGEACMLTDEEKVTVLRTVVRKKKNKLVMAGCTHESTQKTIALTRKAADEGADIASVLTPHYFKKVMTQDALIRFYETVADTSPLPVMIYNAPGFAGGVQLSVDAVVTLSQHPNIIGMKDSAPTGPNVFLAYVGKEKFSVLAGSANFFLSSLVLGAKGGVLSLANYLPHAAHHLYELFQEDKMEEAKNLQQAVLRVNRGVSGKYGVAGVKKAMDITGFYGGEPRLPLLPLGKKEQENVQVAIQEFLQEYPELSSM